MLGEWFRFQPKNINKLVNTPRGKNLFWVFSDLALEYTAKEFDFFEL